MTFEFINTSTTTSGVSCTGRRAYAALVKEVERVKRQVSVLEKAFGPGHAEGLIRQASDIQEEINLLLEATTTGYRRDNQWWIWPSDDLSNVPF